MANNVQFQSSVPATPSSATIVETIDQGGGIQRQVVQISSYTGAIPVSLSSATVTLSSVATVTPSSAINVNFVGIPSVTVSSGTVTLSSNPTVIVSSAVQVTLTSNVVALSSVATVTPSSAIAVSSGTFTLSSNPTVILSSNPTVIPSSAFTVTPSSAISLNSDGWTVSSVILSSGTNSTLVSSRASTLFKVESFNNSTTPGYLKLYNLSSAPTAGSSLVFLRLLVPGNAGGGGVVSEYSGGDTFGTGVGYTFTGGIADSDTTAVSAATYIVNVHYK